MRLMIEEDEEEEAYSVCKPKARDTTYSVTNVPTRGVTADNT